MFLNYENKMLKTQEDKGSPIICPKCRAELKRGSGIWKRDGRKWIHDCSTKINNDPNP